MIFAKACSQACSHGDDVLRKPGHGYGFEEAQFRIQVEHPPIAVPHLTEHASGT